MVTFLDTSVLKAFDVVYAFLFVWALTFAIFHKIKFISQSNAVNALIATALSFIVILSRPIVEMINFMIPWFTVVIIMVVLLLLIFQIFGFKESDMATAVKDKAVYWTLIGIALVIMFAAFSSVYGQSILEAGQQARGEINETSTPGFQQSLFVTLFNPKVLGLIILFAIAVMTIALISSG